MKNKSLSLLVLGLTVWTNALADMNLKSAHLAGGLVGNSTNVWNMWVRFVLKPNQLIPLYPNGAVKSFITGGTEASDFRTPQGEVKVNPGSTVNVDDQGNFISAQ